jgi:hypothetical protein
MSCYPLVEFVVLVPKVVIPKSYQELHRYHTDKKGRLLFHFQKKKKKEAFQLSNKKDGNDKSHSKVAPARSCPRVFWSHTAKAPTSQMLT